MSSGLAIAGGAASCIAGAAFTMVSRLGFQAGESLADSANTDLNLGRAGITLIGAAASVATGIFALAGGITCSAVGVGLLTYGIIKKTGYDQYPRISVLGAAALAGICAFYVGMPSSVTVLR